MKLDFNKNLVDLEGKEVADANMGKLLAQILTQANTGDAIKFWEISVKLYKGDVVDLDTTDQTTIKEFIKSNQNIVNMAKAQLLLNFDVKK